MSIEYNCIDICNYSPSLAKKVNFKKMKEEGVEYVIFRAVRRRLIVDESFEIYYKGAEEAGLKIGVYLYSYAGCNQAPGAKANVKKNWKTDKCVEYARLEAKSVIKLLNGRKLQLPIFYDLEERAQAEVLKRSYINKIAEEFKNIVVSEGYTFGLYCDQDYYNSYIDKTKWKDTPIWIAKYRDPKPTCCDSTKNLVAWQYKGTVSGVGLPSGLSCDRSHWYGIKSVKNTTTTVKEEVKEATVKEEVKEATVKEEFKPIDYYGRISNCTSLNIRKGPGSSYKAVGHYKSNEIVHITEVYYKDGKETGWGKTSLGWISYKKYTTKAIGQITVTCNKLNLRSSMSTAVQNVKYIANKNESFTVMDIKKASNGKIWYWLANNYYCSANSSYTKYEKF